CFLEEGGMPVGVFPDQHYMEGSSILRPGEIILCYTDGITEARNSTDEEFGVERLLQTVRNVAEKDSQSISGVIIETVREKWLGTDQEDDWTLLVARKK